MSETENIEKLVRALKKVPPKSLLLIELSNEVVDDKGELDFDKVIDKQRSINLAVVEAKAYAASTQVAIKALAGLPARKGGY